MRNMPLVSLADIAESTRYGYTASASNKKVGPKFLRITDIVPLNIDWDSVPYCKIEEKDISKFSLQPGDIVIARTGATVGYAKLIREDEQSVFASYLVRIRIDPKKADPGYVGRVVESNIYKRFVLSRVSGAAQPNANAKVLSSFQFPIPDMSTQHRIVSILSAYENLIKNNQRRIELLEQSARLLYREWFVNLRFPGHEHVKVMDGVPEGWDNGCVSDFYDTSSGGTPSRKNPDFFTGEIKWVKTQELLNRFITDTEEKITQEAIKKSSAKLFPEKTVLVAMYGATIGQVGIIASPAASNQACCAIMAKDPRASFMHSFLFFLENKQTLVGLSMGAAQNNINQQIIRSFPMLMPPSQLIYIFNDALTPVFDQWLNLYIQNQKLQEARDILLPKLMSGEIIV
ncbi:restriction endonuclease subunit S [Methanococcoides methylutens]|uniref:Type I restriction-modification system, specificity subunit S n=1 Tax=Methanococcoides methylutens MM1 TaxID=1434104 RepID=A0A0E3SQS5_METMT|nr:restriction endonuclease subunit S [Methanococcoides methylutens]AKB84508.1 Type I restriction-modification system, specificity subunit S [Methanococcoides methylutens MM1]